MWTHVSLSDRKGKKNLVKLDHIKKNSLRNLRQDRLCKIPPTNHVQSPPFVRVALTSPFLTTGPQPERPTGHPPPTSGHQRNPTSRPAESASRGERGLQQSHGQVPRSQAPILISAPGSCRSSSWRSFPHHILPEDLCCTTRQTASHIWVLRLPAGSEQEPQCQQSTSFVYTEGPVPSCVKAPHVHVHHKRSY